MKAMTHIPGPYQVSEANSLKIESADYGGIATVFRPHPDGNRAERDQEIAEATTVLLAAAPELLEACKAAVVTLIRINPTINSEAEVHLSQCRAAIAKATRREHMGDYKDYSAEIDGGMGGNTNFSADSIEEAMSEAVEWALDGDWGSGGFDVKVRVWRPIAEENEHGKMYEEEIEYVKIPAVV